MKESTKMLKNLGNYLSNQQGRIKYKTEIIKTCWTFWELDDWSLAMKYNYRSQHYEIFKIGNPSSSPTFIISKNIVETGNIKFTRCEECGNLAVYNDVDSEVCLATCIEPPVFHQYSLKKLKETAT
jgi:hypothetical protein